MTPNLVEVIAKAKVLHEANSNPLVPGYIDPFEAVVTVIVEQEAIEYNELRFAHAIVKLSLEDVIIGRDIENANYRNKLKVLLNHAASTLQHQRLTSPDLQDALNVLEELRCILVTGSVTITAPKCDKFVRAINIILGKE